MDISPSTDDRPFVGQMGRLKNLEWEKPPMRLGLGVFGYPVTQLIVVIILLVVTVLILPLTSLPYFSKGPRLRASSWLYFFTIGAAFMAVEVVLMQKYALFVGIVLYLFAYPLIRTKAPWTTGAHPGCRGRNRPFGRPPAQIRT